MNLGTFMYEGMITEAFGPVEGLMDEITYSAVAVNTSDPIRIVNRAPRRDKAPGSWVRQAFVGKPCKIGRYNGETFLYVQEEDAVTDCVVEPPPPPPPPPPAQTGCCVLPGPRGPGDRRQTTAAECLALGGTFLGVGVPCEDTGPAPNPDPSDAPIDPGPPPPPPPIPPGQIMPIDPIIGCCRLPDGTRRQMTQTACDNLGGQWLGVGNCVGE